FRDRREGVAFAHRVRDAAREARQTQNRLGFDVSAIEHMDERCLSLLREDGIDRLHGVRIPAGTSIAFLIVLELPAGTTSPQAFDEVDIAVPGDSGRAAQLIAVREAVPTAVNQRIARAASTIDGRIEKTAADMIVPFESIEIFMNAYEAGFEQRGLDFAVWGHISDGNLHPNVIPRSLRDVHAGKEAILELGREAIRLGGSPLAEHGVGRNPV